MKPGDYDEVDVMLLRKNIDTLLNGIQILIRLVSEQSVEIKKQRTMIEELKEGILMR